MRTITIPPVVTIVDPSSRKPLEPNPGVPLRYSLRDLVRWLLDSCGAFNDSAVGARAAMRIDRAFGEPGAVDGGAVVLDDQDHELLRAAAEKPDRGYPKLESRDRSGAVVYSLPLGAQLVPMLDAILDAKKDVAATAAKE